MWINIASSTFTTHSAGTKGGVFYFNSIGKITMTSLTATDFYAPYSGGGGRFFYLS